MKMLSMVFFMFVMIAAGQTKLPPQTPQGIIAKQLKDKVWRFDRPTTVMPALWRGWQQLIGMFSTAKARPFGRSVAFLAGVAEYSHLRPQLTFVDSDLTDLRNFLLTQGGFDTVFEVRNRDVKRSLIEDYMVNKFGLPNAEYVDTEDRLLFYYSGHGADKQRRVGYLQFGNAAPENFAGDDVLPLTQFQEWARLIVAKHLLIILDACATGLAVQAQGDNPADALLNVLSGEGSGFLLTAGTGEQQAYQVRYSRDKGTSVFTRALLDALLADSTPDQNCLMTINEVFGRAEKQIGQFNVEHDKKATPQMWPMSRGDGPAKGTFVFLNSLSSCRIPQRYAALLGRDPKGGDPEVISSGFGTIQVTSTRPGTLSIDGKIQRPMLESGEIRTLNDISAGKHRIVISYATLKPADFEVQEVTVVSGLLPIVAFGAKSAIDRTGKVPVGSLVIVSEEGMSGDIYIDNVKENYLERGGRVTINNIMAGNHQVRLEGSTQSQTHPVQIRAKKTTTLNVPRPKPPTDLTFSVR